MHMLLCDLCDYLHEETHHACACVRLCVRVCAAAGNTGNATRDSTGELCESANLRLSDSQTQRLVGGACVSAIFTHERTIGVMCAKKPHVRVRHESA